MAWRVIIIGVSILISLPSSFPLSLPLSLSLPPSLPPSLPYLPAEYRQQMGMPEKPTKGRKPPRMEGRGSTKWLNFMDPTVGKRLGLFERPSPGAKVMPPAMPSLQEVC